MTWAEANHGLRSSLSLEAPRKLQYLFRKFQKKNITTFYFQQLRGFKIDHNVTAMSRKG